MMRDPHRKFRFLLPELHRILQCITMTPVGWFFMILLSTISRTEQAPTTSDTTSQALSETEESDYENSTSLVSSITSDKTEDNSEEVLESSTIEIESTTDFYQILQEDPGNFTMSEKVDDSFEDNEFERWHLDENNCNRYLNIAQETTKIVEVEFGIKISRAAGQCQITIDGPNGNLLALLVSKIEFTARNETLKVITKARNIPYTIKTFDGNENLSLLLPDTNQVYLIYKYLPTEIQHLSKFRFEVFPYKVRDNLVKPEVTVGSYADSIYITTESPTFRYPRKRDAHLYL